MSNPALYEEVAAKSYEELTANFDWSIAERELGYKPGDPINIGWMCSDRICRLGLADKVALDWEDYQGNQQRFTFDDRARSVQHRRAVSLRSSAFSPASGSVCSWTVCPSCTSASSAS